MGHGSVDPKMGPQQLDVIVIIVFINRDTEAFASSRIAP
jgi:hypothetical protein